MKYKALWLSVFVFLMAACCSTTPVKQAQTENKETHQQYNVMISKRIYVDSKFNPDEIEAIKKGVSVWETTTNGIVKFDVIYDFDMTDNSNTDPYRYINKIIIKRLTTKDKLTIKLDEAIKKQYSEDNPEDPPSEAVVLGYTHKRKSFEFIYIVVDRLITQSGFIDTKAFQNVVMHEIGHELGMQHFDDGPSIMNVQFDSVIEHLAGNRPRPLMCLTKFDMQQFCSLYLCDSEKTKHC